MNQAIFSCQNSYKFDVLHYLTDNLRSLSTVSQLWCIFRSNVVTLLQVKGLLVLQLSDQNKNQPIFKQIYFSVIAKKVKTGQF